MTNRKRPILARATHIKSRGVRMTKAQAAKRARLTKRDVRGAGPIIDAKATVRPATSSQRGRTIGPPLRAAPEAYEAESAPERRTAPGRTGESPSMPKPGRRRSSRGRSRQRAAERAEERAQTAEAERFYEESDELDLRSGPVGPDGPLHPVVLIGGLAVLGYLGWRMLSE